MTFNITDGFTGASGTAITSHTTDQGHSYVRPAGGTSGVYQLDGNGAISDNNSGLDAFAVVNSTISDADYSVGGLIDGGYQQLIFRCDKAASARTYYTVFFHPGVGEWIMYKLVAGTQTEIGRGAAAYSPVGTPRNAALRGTGTTLELLIEGTSRLSFTDSSITAAGTGGFSGTGMESFVMSGAGTATGAGNSAPVITSNGGGATASISVPENTTAVTTVTATDAENNSLTYSISGGADSSKFAIDGSTGVLTFVTAPNFEAPTDVGGNNIYDVIVSVTDGSSSDTQAIAVTVTNVAEVVPKARFVVLMG